MTAALSTQRTGSDLVRATKPWTEEQTARSWTLLVTTLLVWAALVAVTFAAPWWPVKLAGSVLIGFTIVRMFIFIHDYLHGAIFRGSAVAKALVWLGGLYVLTPPPVWRETHDYHHQNNAKLLGSSIGSYPLVNLAIWRRMTPSQRRGYRVLRHPLTIALAYLTLFVIGMCIAPFRRAPRRHWHGMVFLAIHAVVLGSFWWAFGFLQALTVLIIPSFLSSALGAYLFYAQHNFQDTRLRGRREWAYDHAALHCSSMFDMSPAMHWFTGNIGYHHVHHLNHKIPFYRLPEAMAAMPELQDPPRTSWAPSEVMACLRVGLWDEKAGQIVSYREADSILAARAAGRG